MRLELALIVGILFFCSWCAYIVARMNASVSAGESGLSAMPQTNSNQVNWTRAGGHGQDAYQEANKPSYLPGHQVQQHHFGASEPEGAWQQQQQHQMGAQAPYAFAAGPQLQPSQPAPFHQAANLAPIPEGVAPPARWQNYALPTRLAPAAAPELPDPQADSDPADYEDEDTAASDYVSPQQQLEEAAGEPEADSDSDEPANEADEEQGQPERGSQLDELSQRRHFNELESGSNERDKDGVLVQTRRRHLINGKPVARARRRRPLAAGLENEETNYAESARDNQRAHRSRRQDFERLVGELDREHELRKLRDAAETAKVPKAGAAPASGQQAHRKRAADALIGAKVNGRPQWSVAERLMRRSGALGGRTGSGAWRQSARQAQVGANPGRPVRLEKKKKTKGKKDEHEHRLQETLEQQQWDDDAASNSDQQPESGPEAGGAADEEKVSDVVDQDEEARQLEDMSRELMRNPHFAELTRRRRSSEYVSDSGQGSASPREHFQALAEEGNESGEQTLGQVEDADSCRQGCAAEDGRPDEPQDMREPGGQDDARVVPADLDDEQAARRQLSQLQRAARDSLEPTVMGPNSFHASQLKAPKDDSESGARPVTNESSLDNAASEAEVVAPSNRSTLIISDIGSRNRPQAFAGGSPSEIVSSLEDMHVEILAQPPLSAGPDNFATPAGPQQPPAAAPLHPAGPSGLAEFPRVASPFASGSSKVGKKKKARKYSKKRSKLIDSKYKAARAYARSQRSKQKKGQMRKKKRKSEKKLIAGAKHFAGSTRGHKKAHGRGLEGARKGSTFYKDKGYRKKGFKKAYHKLETGDHKTYFDEFRDKDHNKKWKDFDDKHKYSQRKKWAGKDVKHLKHHDLSEARGRASKSGRWRESAKSEHMKKAKKYRKANKVAKKSYSSEAVRNKTKTKKKTKRKEH